jgi:NAD(P)-dependent dehydrogenase (short-subunit alcohol dehydrogenase family)
MPRTIVVTGSNGGIGAAICQKFKDAGDRVIASDIQSTGAGDHAYSSCDLGDVASIEALFGQVEQQHGGAEVLINAAGVYHGKTFLDISPADYDATLSVNLRGLFFATQIFARGRIAKKSPGIVVNIASIAGRLGSATSDYGASKAAVIALTRSLGKSLAGHQIRVNGVAPGLVETKMGDLVPKEQMAQTIATIPVKRRAKPSEIADVIAFLASDQSAYMTGATVDVNGGWY